MNLKDKTIVVSGASRGIGLAIALRAARDGAKLVLIAKTAAPHPSLPGTIYTAAAEIEAAGGQALPIVCDVRDEEQIESAVEKVIGVGRVGTRVLNRTIGFGTPRILVNDVKPGRELGREFKLEWVSKEKLYQEADIISLHVPLTHLTKNMIRKEQLRSMKADAIVINTARGGIINEQDLYEVMQTGHLSGAAIDVFESEPYAGNLREIQRCILTAHLGSMSVDCRTRMEIEATKEAVRFLTGIPLESIVPIEEYDVQRHNL